MRFEATTAREYFFVVPLILAMVVIIYHSVVIAKIMKHGTHITDRTLWLPMRDREIPKDMAGTDISGPSKSCRIEPTPRVRDIRGETITNALEVPCGDCSNYIYKIGKKCIPMTFQVHLQEGDTTQLPTGFCVPSASPGDPEYEEMVGECPFRVRDLPFK
jgi:hypothetical protein